MGPLGVLSVLSTALLALTPFAAAADSDMPEPAGAPIVSFIAVADATFPEVIDSLNASNAPEDVAAFLSAQAQDPSPELVELGLSNTPVDAARDLIEEAAAEASAEAGADSDASAPLGRAGVMAIASFSVRGPSIKLSVESAPVGGQAVNNGFSWRRADRAFLRECNGWSCSTRSWLDWRVVTDPGKNGTRTNVQFVRGGEGKLAGVRLQTIVLSNGRNISDVTGRWNANVSGQYQYNSNHASTQGRNFQMYYRLEFIGPNNLTSSYEFKSNRSAPCSEPHPGAYRCSF